jgi:hypothetical protein
LAELPGSRWNLGYNAAAMVAFDTNVVRRIIGSTGLILAYGLSLWRIFKSNPGEKFIQCATITVMILVVTIAAIRTQFFPDWVLTSLECLLYLLTFLSIFFMFQEGYRALRRRKNTFRPKKQA